MLIASALLVLLVTLGLNTQLSGTLDRHAGQSDVPAFSLPAAAPALIGTWDRQSDGSPALRMVVKAVYPGWADVVVACGDDSPRGAFTNRMRARARLLEEGGFHVSGPLHMTFVLSEDRNLLVGTRTPLDPLAAVVLARKAADHDSIPILPLPESQ
jgi:hypothetical protein